MIIKCGIRQPIKFQLVSRLNWIKNEIITYRISELMLATLIQLRQKKSFHFKNERLTEILQSVRCRILLLYYIIKPFLDTEMSCFFFRNMEPLKSYPFFYYVRYVLTDVFLLHGQCQAKKSF